MSTLFIDDREARAREQELLTTQTDYSALAPGKLEGLPSGLEQAVSRAGAGLFALGADIDPYTLNGQLARAVASAFGRDLGAQQQDIAKRWLNDSRLDPATHGSVANILYGVGSFAPALAASAVNPLFGAAVAGGTTFEGSTSDLRASGVDADTAHLAAASDAAFAALGALLPGAFGTSRALNTLAVGPGINIAQDVASRYATASLLESNGYDELAGQYRHMDANTLIADAILGGGFGYLGARAKQHEVDAAQVQQRIRAAMLAGPGAPVDGISLAKHAAALEKAQADLLSGRPVDVSGIEGAQFLRDPQNALAAVLERNGYADEAEQIRALESELASRGIASEANDLPDLPPSDPMRAAFFTGLRDEIGWAERGGRMIRGELKDGEGALGEVVGRTAWIGKHGPDGTESTFWRMRPDASLTEKQAHAAIEKHAKGDPLGPREQRFIDYAQRTADQYAADYQADAARTDVDRLGDEFDMEFAPGDREEAAAVAAAMDRAYAAGATEADVVGIIFEGDLPGVTYARLIELAKAKERHGTVNRAEKGNRSSDSQGAKGGSTPDAAQARPEAGAGEALEPHEQAVVDTAHDIAAEHPDTEFGDALARSDDSIAQAESESVQFPVAVACFLRHGA